MKTQKLDRWIFTLLLVVTSLMLGGCKAETTEHTQEYVLPAELQDCKVYSLHSTGNEFIRIVRCPNSTTSATYTSGKRQATTIVVDGIEYAPVPTPAASGAQ